MANAPIIAIKSQSKWYWYETSTGEKIKIPAGIDILYQVDGSDIWEISDFEQVEIPPPLIKE